MSYSAREKGATDIISRERSGFAMRLNEPAKRCPELKTWSSVFKAWQAVLSEARASFATERLSCPHLLSAPVHCSKAWPWPGGFDVFDLPLDGSGLPWAPASWLPRTIPTAKAGSAPRAAEEPGLADCRWRLRRAVLARRFAAAKRAGARSWK